jgi:uncharacterized membrane protein (DUF4010 family)
MAVELDPTVVRNFLVALLIGALVGVEREKRKASSAEVSFGGLRTFILFAEAGAVSAWISSQVGSVWIFGVALLAVATVVTVGYVLESRVNPDSFGLTTELSAICVFLLGGAVMYGNAEIAVGLAVVTASVLAFKQPLHGIVEKLGTDDIYAGLRLLIATFIVLPLLPARTIDPWNALNPYALWLLVILISSLSLVGYVAMRWLGNARGAVVTGIAGGLVSSTAVTLSFARQSKLERDRQGGDSLATGILLAWTVMFARILVAVAIVDASLLSKLALPFGAVGVVAATGAAVCYRRGSRGTQSGSEPTTDVPLRNPFSLLAACKFGLLFAMMLLAVKLSQTYLPLGGLYAVAALAGLTDVDAITLSMARFSGQGGDATVAAGAIVLAALSNTLVKCGLVVGLGSRSLGARIAVATAALVVAGLASFTLAS